MNFVCIKIISINTQDLRKNIFAVIWGVGGGVIIYNITSMILEESVFQFFPTHRYITLENFLKNNYVI